VAADQEAVLAQLTVPAGDRHKDNLLDGPRSVGTIQCKQVLQINGVVVSEKHEAVRQWFMRQCAYAGDELRTGRDECDEFQIRRCGRTHRHQAEQQKCSQAIDAVS
jgi:hypothetical protein